MRSYDGYADMLSGSSVQIAMSGDEEDLTICAHGPDGVKRDLRLMFRMQERDLGGR